MSSLKVLLQNLSPSEVIYSSIEFVCNFNRGKWIKANQLINGPYPVVTSGQKVTEFHNQFNRSGEIVTIASSGAYAGYVNFWNQEIYLSNAFTVDPKNPEQLLPKFLFYILKDNQNHIHSLASRGGVPNVYGHDLNGLQIPLPPIQIQVEIIRVLDLLTMLEAELEGVLEEELRTRKTQHQYFCESIFAFKDEETNMTFIKDICRISRGTVISKDYLRDRPGEFPVYSSQTLNNGIFGYIDTFAYDFESLTWTTDGANAGSIFFHQNEKFTITNVCGLLQVIDPTRISTRYLYYVLRAEAPKHVSAGMGNPKLMAGTMGEVKIHIPSMERQLKIVRILDKYEAVLNDISINLLEEIASRKQQFEHYRSKLLTFRDLETV